MSNHKMKAIQLARVIGNLSDIRNKKEISELDVINILSDKKTRDIVSNSICIKNIALDIKKDVLCDEELITTIVYLININKMNSTTTLYKS